MLIDMQHPRLSVLRQCDMMGLARNSLNYRAQGEDAYNQPLMHGIDRLDTARPFYGGRRMTAVRRPEGLAVNDKRVRRIMRVMGRETIEPWPRTSLNNHALPVEPYRVNRMTSDRDDHGA